MPTTGMGTIMRLCDVALMLSATSAAEYGYPRDCTDVEWRE